MARAVTQDGGDDADPGSRSPSTNTDYTCPSIDSAIIADHTESPTDRLPEMNSVCLFPSEPHPTAHLVRILSA